MLQAEAVLQSATTLFVDTHSRNFHFDRYALRYVLHLPAKNGKKTYIIKFTQTYNTP